jgi:hypothetical protein
MVVALYLLAPVLNIWKFVEILNGCIVHTGPCLYIWMVAEILDGCNVLTGPCSEHLYGCRYA